MVILVRHPDARSLACAAIALLCLTLPQAAAQLPAADTTLMVRPADMARLVADPYLGGVWIGTSNGAFHKDLQSGAIRQYLVRDGLPSPYVWDFVPTPDAVWIATQAGLVRLDRGTGELQPVLDLDGARQETSAQALVEAAGRVWLGTLQDGLFSVDPGTRVATPVPNPINGSRFQHPIMGLAAEGGHLFISTSRYGLVDWDQGSGSARRFSKTSFLQEPEYRRVLATPSDVWIATDGDGAMQVHRADGSITQWDGPGNVNAPIVKGLTRVGEEIWFASLAGVARYTPSTNSWKSWPLGTSGQGGTDVALAEGTLYAVSEKYVNRFERDTGRWAAHLWWHSNMILRHNTVQDCLDEGSRLTFGTGGGGVNYLDLATGRWVQAGPEDGDQARPRDINVLGVARDGGTRWFATYNGVSEQDIASGQYTNYFTDGREGLGRGWNVVNDVAVDGGQVWFATGASLQPKARHTEPDVWNHGNVARMDRATRSLTIYGRAAGLSSENVTVVLPDQGRVWIGSLAGGLDVLDKASGRITHVASVGDKVDVNALLLRPEGLWVGTTGKGLLLVDPATLQATGVPSVSSLSVTALASADGLLWLGTAGQGLRALDPATREVAASSVSGFPIDMWTHCVLPHDGILYLGTNWGVQRFQLAERRLLPQVARWTVEAGASPGPSAPTGSIHIDSPTDGADVREASLTIHGTADVPPGARVLVRTEGGPWALALGSTSWTADLAVGDVTGPVTLVARLDLDGQAIATASVTVSVVRQEAAVSEPAVVPVEHVPLLQAHVGQPVHLEVAAPGAGELATATLHLRRPGQADNETLDMAPAGPDRWAIDLEPFRQPGSATYRITLQWPGGGAHLPDVDDGFGTAYTLVVTAPSGRAAGKLAVREADAVSPGQEAEVRLVLQNVGSADASFQLSFKGPLARWIVDAPADVAVPAGESRDVVLHVRVPASARGGSYGLEASAALAGGTAAQAETALKVATDSAEPEVGAPSPAWPALAALAIAAAARRRRA